MRMFPITQLLVFELGSFCNLSHIHPKCPSSKRPQSFRPPVPDDRIVELVREAYHSLGFKGLVGWHFYNEPMLQYGRMLKLMRRIREVVPESRFILWTNGTVLPNLYDDVKLFEQVLLSDYFRQGWQYFQQFYPTFEIASPPAFDERLEHYGLLDSFSVCVRPFVEFIVDDKGDVYLCCQDWRHEVDIGNVGALDLDDLDKRKWEITKTIYKKMSKKSPKTCLKCNNKYPTFEGSSFDSEIIRRTMDEIQKTQTQKIRR